MNTIVDAYALLDEQDPSRRWQYGEMGWKDGGAFPPHKTHQNGLSADFFVPVSGSDGKADMVPISILNKFGYEVEFDRKGHAGKLSIDWQALTSHLLALESAGKKYGVKIARVILAPELQSILRRKDKRSRRFKRLFSRRKAWVRHDEHYHIDFSIPKRLRKPLRCD